MFEGLRNKRFTTLAFVVLAAITIQSSAQVQQETTATADSSVALTPVKSANGKWGYRDNTGAFVIPAQFDKVTEFSEGLAAVTLHKKIGYIDSTGQIVIPPSFVHGEPFREGLALVYTTWGMNIFGRTEGWDLFRRAGYIDHTGKIVIRPRLAENASSFSEGVAAFQPGVASPGRAKWGYLDKNGKWAIEPRFEIASDFSEGLAAAEVSTGKELGKKEPTYKWGYIDHSGNFVIAPQFSRAMPFARGIAVVHLWNIQGHLHPRGCIDKEGKLADRCPARKPEKIPGSTLLRQ